MSQGKPSNLDEILIDYVGGFGWWQVRILALFSFFEIFSSSKILIHTLAGHRPNYRCSVPACDNGTEWNYENTWFNETLARGLWADPECELVVDSNGSPVNWCDSNLDAWNPKKQNFSTRACEAWVYERTTFQETLTTEFDLVCSKGAYIEFIGSLFMLGLLIGALMGGFVGDALGRKKTVLLSCFLTGPMYLGQAFAPNYYSYAVLSLIGVISNYVGAVGAFPLKMEMVSHQYRRYVFLLRDMVITLGNVMTGCLAYFVTDWRTLHILCSAPLLLQPLMYFVLPESISWLVSKGNYQGAVKALTSAAKKNRNTKVDHDEAQLLISSMALQVEAGELEGSTNCCSLITQSSIRFNILVMAVNWIAVTLTWYGLAYNIDILSGDIILNFQLMSLVDLPACFGSFLLLGCMGRKQTLFLCQLGSGLACVTSGLLRDPHIWAMLGVDLDPTLTQNILCFTGKFFAAMAFSVCYLYTLELFPTQIRSTSLGLCSAMARVFGILTPYMKRLGIFWLPLPFVVMGIPSILGGLLTLFLPETRGKALPENFQQAVSLHNKSSSSKNQ